MDGLDVRSPVPLGRALVGMLTDPRGTFARFPERQPWFVAMLVFGLVTAVAHFWMFSEILPDVTQEAIDASQVAGLPPDQAETAARVARGMTLIFGVLGGLFGPALQVLVTTVAVWLVTRVARLGLTFSSLFSVATYAYLPLLLLTVLIAVLAGLGVYDVTTVEGIPPTSLRVLAPGLEPGFLADLLSRVELFALWSTVLLGLGLAARSGRPAGQGLGLAVAAWLLVVLAFSALSGLVPEPPSVTAANWTGAWTGAGTVSG